MRVDIKGNNPVTGENVKWVIDELNKKYADLGLEVKNLTCYIRFQDKTGQTVEPTSNGAEIHEFFDFKATKDIRIDK